MYYHRFSAPAEVAFSLTRSSQGQKDAELVLNGGTIEFNRGEPNTFTLTSNVEFQLDYAGGFGGQLIIEQNGPGLVVNLRISVDTEDRHFLMPMLQRFGERNDIAPYIEFWSNYEFKNEETPYKPIEKIELYYSKGVS
jgi:hypothetical protein